jgi:hypothetical protein
MDTNTTQVEVYAIDLDEEVISHLAIHDSFMFFRDEKVSIELIEDDFVRRVYQWTNDHYSEHHKVPTASVIAEEFELEIEAPLTAVGDLLTRLRERFVKNHAREHMERIGLAYKEDPAKVIEVLPQVARDIQSIVGIREEEMGTGDYDRAMSHYDEMVLSGPGGSFGFEALDQHFHGLKGVTFCIAAPKTYKSWITINAAVENITQGKNVHLHSLELPADESDMRVRCLAAGVPYWRYLRGSLSKDDRDSLKTASELLDSMGTYKCIKPSSGHRSIEEITERAGEAGADMILIDQLQYLETTTGKRLGSGDTTHYWDVLNSARDLSDAMPMWIVHQFNRSVMGADRMPEMQQAKGSASIEEVATLALGLWANRDMRKSGIIELGTLASRNYTFKSWEIGLDLTKTCDFSLIGEVEHDD